MLSNVNNGAGDKYRSSCGASSEGELVNIGNAGGKVYVFKSGASEECMVADHLNAAKIDFCKTRISSEGKCTDFLNAVGNGYLGERRALVEYVIVDFGKA